MPTLELVNGLSIRRLVMVLCAVAAIVLAAIVLAGSPSHHEALMAWAIVALGAGTIVAAVP